MPQTQKEEFTALLKDCLDVMYRVALRLTKDESQAEDLISDTCLSAWKNFVRLKNHRSFKSWILRIMTNTYISSYRKLKNQPGVLPESALLKEGEDFSLFEELSSPLVFYETNPEKEFIKNLFWEDVAKAVDNLPDIYRAAVVLCCFEDIRYKEAAKILNLPIGTVRSRLSRGKAMLQKILWTYRKA